MDQIKTPRSLMRNYFIVIAATLTSNILALVREILTAKYFGVSASIDSFVVAFSFISIFTYMFTSGLMQSATIPLFAQYSQDADKGKAFFSNLMSFVSLASGLLILTIIGAVLYLPGLLSMIAPGFSPEEILNVRIYIEILSVIVFFVVLGSVMISILQFRGAFFTSFSSYIVNNIVIIVFLLAFAGIWGIKSVVIGTSAGGFFGFLVLVWFTSKERISYSFRPIQFDHKIKSFLAAITPIFLFIFFSQIEMMFEKAFVSATSSGNIAALNYAYKLALIPVMIFGTGLAIAGFPALASLIANKKTEDAIKVSAKITESLRALVYSLIPLSVFLYVFSVPCIRFFLERGIFSAEASVRTGAALQYYALGILGQAMIIYLCRIFYAYRDFWTPLKIGAVVWGMQILLCWALVRWVGYTGVAMANALCVYLCSGAMILVLLRKFIPINVFSIIRFLAKMVILAVISAISSISLIKIAGIGGKLSVIGNFVIFGFIFLLGTYLLKTPETMVILSKARGFFKKTKGI